MNLINCIYLKQGTCLYIYLKCWVNVPKKLENFSKIGFMIWYSEVTFLKKLSLNEWIRLTNKLHEGQISVDYENERPIFFLSK